MKMQQVSRDVFADKYAVAGETRIKDTFDRVAKALAANEAEPEHWEPVFRKAFDEGLLLAGRIMAGAGTGSEVTLINCFVQPVGDSMDEIMQAVGEAAETMRRGGGVGYDFSRIRPKGAKVKRTGSIASGPLSYMRVFDAMCDTISSKGSRRGAQMGVLRCDHPDIEAFIEAKAAPWEEKELTRFNISVGVTDAFMEAVKQDADWALVHKAEPDDESKANGAVQDGKRWVYRTVRARDLWEKIMRSTYDHADPGVLFIDRMNAENNLAYCERIEATNPCGEQPLPDYGCCCLGPINLAKLVRNPFTATARFDYEKLAELSRIGVRMLDNVLDITYWPLEEQWNEAMAKRRIGLGFTGLGDALIMLGLAYESQEARRMAATIAQTMRDTAYEASVELAREKGAFPRFEAEAYLQSGFARRLPKGIREAIATHGIRNSHLLSIAPTGTVSLAFGDNCSSGIEPVFEWIVARNVKQPDGSWKSYQAKDHAFRLYQQHLGAQDEPVEEVIAGLPAHWVRARDMEAEAHLEMVAAVAPYIDTSISKTINVASDYPYEDFKDIYRSAFEKGLKGVTTFRENPNVQSVLRSQEDDAKDQAQAAVQPEDLEQSDPDRRLRLKEVPTVALASLRWQKRPDLPAGNPAWCYMVDHPHGYQFAVFVGHIENGTDYPFEVWVNGAEQPRALGALAKSLSMDMRCNDRTFLKAKLDSLCKASADDGFDLTLPTPTVDRQQVPSLVAGFATLVNYRCEQLGTFDLEGPTPVMDAVLFRKEPKTGTEGTMSWTVDVHNEAMGDDFVLGLKELTLPNGQRRPYSLWLAGEYPRVLDGLCKLLSWDMRVADPAWIGAKLRQLLDYAEVRGDFWAKVPGEQRSRVFPSTVAYLARLVIHRFAMLGILDEEGYPMEATGVLTIDGQAANDAADIVPLKATGAVENGQMAGARCPECGNYAVIRRDGCSYCTACGTTGDCG